MKANSVSVTRTEYSAFVGWASQQTTLHRGVVLIVEPPFEEFFDVSAIRDTPRYSSQDRIAGAMLMTEYPQVGILDPRPADQRSPLWWRERCSIRQDWFEKWQASKEEQP